MANKISILLIVCNVILIVFAIFIYGQLQTTSQRVDILEAENNKIVPNRSGSAKQIPKQAIPTQKQTKIVAMEVFDDGFSPSGFHLPLNEFAKISLTNKGEKPHSFVIDELNINSGAIDPGQTKELEFGQDIKNATSFRFYSNAEGDDKEKMNGSIVIF